MVSLVVVDVFVNDNLYRNLYLVNYYCFSMILEKYLSESFLYDYEYRIHYTEDEVIRDRCFSLLGSSVAIDDIYSVVRVSISDFGLNGLYVVYRFVPDFVVSYLFKDYSVIDGIYFDGYEDYHIHFGALYYNIQSWLLRLHPDILGNVRAVNLFFRNRYRLRYDVRRLYVLLSIIRLYLLYSYLYGGRPDVDDLNLVIDSVVDRGVSSRLLDMVSVRYVRWLWYQLGGGPYSSSRLDPLARSNSVDDLLGVEYGLYDYYRGSRDRFYLKLFNLYIGYMVFLHQFHVVNRVYLGLEHFVNVFRGLSRLTTSNRRAIRLRGVLVSSGLSFKSVSRYHIKVSIDSRDFKVLESIVGRDPGILDKMAFFTSFLKAPCSVRGRGRVSSGYQASFRCFNLLDRVVEDGDTLLRWISRDTALRRGFTGLDVAGPEKASPNWVFSLPFVVLRSVISSMLRSRLASSYHAGEDYISLFRGLRSIYETIVLIPRGRGDRIGHGYALGLHPLVSGAGLQPAQEVLEDLVWEYMLYSSGVLDDPGYRVLSSLETGIYNLSSKIYSRPYKPEAIWDGYKALFNIPALASNLTGLNSPLEPWQSILLHYYNTLTSMARRHGYPYKSINKPIHVGDDASSYLNSYLTSREAITRGSTPVQVKGFIGPNPLRRTREIRDYLIGEIRRNNLLIEVCPSSNAALHNLDHPVQHPLLNYLRREGIADELVVIGTDDPGILNTDIALDSYYSRNISRV